MSLIGVAVAIVFVRRQRTLADPLLDLRLFGNRSFSAALLGMLLGTFTMGAMMLFITQYFQLVAGLTAFVAGLWMIPAMIGSVIGNLAAPLLARTFRPAYVIGGGLVVSVIGLLTLTQAGAHGGAPHVMLGFAMTNLGAGPLVALATDLVVGSAPEQKAGSAASISEVSGEFGYALGVALLGSVGALVYRSEMPGGASDAARESLAGARESGTHLDAAMAAFTSGMHVTAVVSAVLLAAVAAVVARLLRGVPPTGTQAQQELAATN
jgi:DHA2 family multidrug resistance protein-like MFS transporter